MIAASGKREHRQKGFTLAETLLVVGILTILLSVSAVAVSHYMHSLQITRLDHAAEEIYMAAQNRAILLGSNERLSHYVDQTDRFNNEIIRRDDAGNPIGGPSYYIGNQDAETAANIKELLPEGSLETGLWDDDFYIVYEPLTASVISVFYSSSLDVGADFQNFYDRWSAASRKERMEQRPMIGYYSGGGADGGTSVSLRTPVINIINKETLKAEVTYWVPGILSSETTELSVELEYPDKSGAGTVSIPLTQADAEGPAEIDTVLEPGYTVYTVTYLLDSLETGKHFKDLLSRVADAGAPGGDFTITAEVGCSSASFHVNGAAKSAAGNSLFAGVDKDGQAQIASFRHLQNLEPGVSGVQNITGARQISDITCVDGEYFVPVNNMELNSYDGQNYEIRNLKIKSAASAGLFGQVSGAPGNPWKFQNIRLANTQIIGSVANNSAGALVGRAEHAALEHCLVYWDKNKANELAQNASDIQYKINGATAGGLAGCIRDCTVKSCFAATAVAGSGAKGGVGGLFGQVLGKNEVERCYADCYVKSDSVQAAGLVGDVQDKASVSLKDCYAVGFLDSAREDVRAGGLCMGAGKTVTQNVYSAMVFTEERENYPLCQTNGSYGGTNTYYLEQDLYFQDSSAGLTEDIQKCARHYNELAGLDAESVTGLFGDQFERKSRGETCAYGLQEGVQFDAYDYPGLKGLPHYGDWLKKFPDIWLDLVYYEIYEKDGVQSYGIWQRDGVNTLDPARQPVQDGYAVFVEQENVEPDGDVSVVYRYFDSAENRKKITVAYRNSGTEHLLHPLSCSLGDETKQFYLAFLPDEIVNSNYAAETFYQELTFSLSDTVKRYYFNPHFAGCILPCQGTDLMAETEKMLHGDESVTVRTPRQLYLLSLHPEYQGKAYHFAQALDLDYQVYSGYGLFEEKAGGVTFLQNPIGMSEERAFMGNYDGNSHAIRHVGTKDDGSMQYVGLFGYNRGSLVNVVYQMDPGALYQTSTEGGISAGGLVGYQAGTVRNCAVDGADLTVRAKEPYAASVALGGLAGTNDGIIENSSAEVSKLRAEQISAVLRVGGFAGENRGNGSIHNAYVVGRVAVTDCPQARAGGFTAFNEGQISHSYAATDLNGDNGASAFCQAGVGAVWQCYYLKGGSFTYRDQEYETDGYTDSYAGALDWKSFTDTKDDALPHLRANGFTWPIKAMADAQKLYPMPGIVWDKNTMSAVHYGFWPVPVDLGEAGIYYWEKMTVGHKESYHFRSISIDLAAREAATDGNLSYAHEDGGRITDYGYGYYYRDDGEALTDAWELSSTGIYDGGATVASERPAAEDEGANQAMRERMGQGFTFHSYRTWDGTDGIYTSRADGGTMTLTGASSANHPSVRPVEITFAVHPFFAEAFSLQKIQWEGGVIDTAGAPQGAIGKEGLPYGVRSVRQLQLINWNAKRRDTSGVISDTESVGETDYIFLDYAKDAYVSGKKLCWEQTHDLDGKGSSFTPIAAYKTQGTALRGWFGGSYDGGGYAIKNINIAADTANYVGLFGVAVNAELKNIILYSEKGDNTVAVHADGSAGTMWHSAGGLAGLAVQTGGGAPITNCAVAGYQVKDCYLAQEKGSIPGTGTVGGLVGMCNTEIVNCTAQTSIFLEREKDAPSGGRGGILAGGLAGSTQNSIQNCYAGGRIEKQIQDEPADDFAGGLVGSFFMRPFAAGTQSVTDLQSTDGVVVQDCYAYMEIGDGFFRHYAVAGTAREEEAVVLTEQNFSNSYYLEHFGDQCCYDVSSRYVSAVTFHALGAKTDSNPFYGSGSAYANVSEEQNNAGRYTFPAVDVKMPAYQAYSGVAYPFPAIITRREEGQTKRLHFGVWPLNGLVRETGGFPIELDLFAKQEASEVITLCNASLGDGVSRVWSAAVSDGSIAAASVDAAGGDSATLHVQSLHAGETEITIACVETVQGSPMSYEVRIPVIVTADLAVGIEHATDRAVTVLAGGRAQAALKAFNQKGEPIGSDVDWTIDHITADREALSVSVSQADESGRYQIEIASDADAVGPAQVALSCTYHYQGATYQSDSKIFLKIAKPEIAVRPLEIYLEGSDEKSQEYPLDHVVVACKGMLTESLQILSAVSLSDDVAAVTVKDGFCEVTGKKQETDTAKTLLKLKVSFWMDGMSCTMGGITVPVTVQNGSELIQNTPKEQEPDRVQDTEQTETPVSETDPKETKTQVLGTETEEER